MRRGGRSVCSKRAVAAAMERASAADGGDSVSEDDVACPLTRKVVVGDQQQRLERAQHFRRADLGQLEAAWPMFVIVPQLHSKRANKENASAVEPANPARILS